MALRDTASGPSSPWFVLTARYRSLVLPRHHPSQTPSRSHVWVSIVVALTLLTAAGCGDGPTSPPVSVDAPKASQRAGIQDDSVYQPGQDPTARVRMMAESGASLIRVDLLWSQVAPTRPTNPSDPGDPAYQWAEYDRLLDVAKANTLEVMFAVWGTPTWAGDPTVKLPAKDVFPQAKRPKDAADFGAFATAAATRFAPRGVTRWEAWNEPNIKLFLYPQYERQANRWVATSPETYSNLLKSFYAGVKAADPDAIVAGAVTAPTGDRCGPSCRVGKGQPTAPNRVRVDDFLDALDAPGRRPPMDVVSHHPYPTTPPRVTTRPDRNFIDLYNLDALSAAIDRTYLRGKKIWLTEYGFGTAPVPQNPKFFTLQQQADFIVDAFERMRATPRVELMVYYFLRDHRDWKSGLIDEEGTPKPGLAAYALPFGVAGGTPGGAGVVRLVGQARASTGRTQVRVEWKSSDTWRKLVVADTAADGTFAVTVRPTTVISVRAVWEGLTRSGQRMTWTSPDVVLPASPAP